MYAALTEFDSFELEKLTLYQAIGDAGPHSLQIQFNRKIPKPE